MANFGFTQPQAEAILDMRLQRLTGLERQKIVDEYKELMQLIEKLRAILASDKLLLEEIRKELIDIRQRFGDKRRTEIIPEAHDITIEDMIADEDMVITVTSSGYVKRSPLSLYRAQGRGGKGRTGMTTKDGDFVEHLFVASAHSYVLVFTQSGRVFWIKVHEIPQAGPAAKGKAIVNLLNLEGNDAIATTIAVRDFAADRFLVFATEKGTIKKTALSEYGNPRAGVTVVVKDKSKGTITDIRMVDMGPIMPVWAARPGPMRSIAIMTRITGKAVQAVALSRDSQITSGATAAADSGRSTANCAMHNTQATLVARPPSRSAPSRCTSSPL